MHPHLLSCFLGDSEAHLNNAAPYFSASLSQKISALISCADPGLGAFHFVKRPWVLRPEIGPNGLKYCFYILYGRRGRKGEGNAGHISSSPFHKPFFPPRLLSMKVFLSASGLGLTKKTTQICLQIHFKIVSFNPNFGG